MGFGGMAISQELYKYINDTLPKGSTILELGSGFGTGELAKTFTMFSIEHDKAWVNKFNSTYIYATIKQYTDQEIPYGRPNWYDIEVLKKEMPESYDLILIDGPLGKIGREGFHGFLNLFNTEAVMIFDDIGRDGERILMEKVAEALQKDYKKYGTGPKAFGVING